jgi:hypothetical protein
MTPTASMTSASVKALSEYPKKPGNEAKAIFSE